MGDKIMIMLFYFKVAKCFFNLPSSDNFIKSKMIKSCTKGLKINTRT